MTERGLPIPDGAPACPFVAFDDDRDERAASPDHRHRCYAEGRPAPRALAHQEAYCLSSAFPVCPTFQDWARREAARSRADAPKPIEDEGGEAGMPHRNPPRNWAAPPPWMSRADQREGDDADWGDDDDGADEGAPPADASRADVPRRGRGLSGSFADRVASDSADDMPGGLPDEDDVDEEVAIAGAGAATPPDSRPRPAATLTARPEPSAPNHRAPGWDEDGEEPADEPPRRFRRRERDAVGPVAPGRAGGKAAGGPAPEWERARPLEAYPTLRSRRLPELSIPPVLVGVVALALAAAVLFALPGLLGFGNPSADSSAAPTTPIITPLPSFDPTPIPQPTPTIYVVVAGDTLSRIAGRYGIALADLIAANAETLPDPDTLQIGDRLVIPVPLATEIPAASEIPAAT
jgi:LysM domain